MPTQRRLRPEGLDALDAGIVVLESFASAVGPMSLAEVSSRVGLSKSRVYRILCTLKHHGLVEQPLRGGPYSLGSKLGILANLAATPSLPRVAASIMAELAQELRGTVVLRVIENGEQLTLDCVHSPEVLRTSYPVGAPLPVYYGSSGKVLLAFRPAGESQALLRAAGPLQGTRKAIVDPAEYRRELARVRQAGFAVNVEETVLGVRGVAAPVLDSDGRAAAAIAVSFPAAALPRARHAETGRRLREAARTIAARLGYREPEVTKSRSGPGNAVPATSNAPRRRRTR
jgi:DNA-binding IclR family transcriptional regulator